MSEKPLVVEADKIYTVESLYGDSVTIRVVYAKNWGSDIDPDWYIEGKRIQDNTWFIFSQKRDRIRIYLDPRYLSPNDL